MAYRGTKTSPKPLAGAHSATVRGALLIREILKLRRQRAILAKRSAFLTKELMQEGCGTAHGYRSYVQHSAARSYYAHKKAYSTVKLVTLSVTPKK